MMPDDLYERLNLDRYASFGDIKAAYRDLAKELHPDIAGEEGQEDFLLLSEAYHTLMDEGARAHYDATGSAKKDFIADEHKVTQVLLECFSVFLDHPKALHSNFDIIREMSGAITMHQFQKREECKLLQQKIDRLQKINKKIRTDGDSNVFDTMVQSKVAGFKKTLGLLSEAGRVFDLASEEIENYTSVTLMIERRSLWMNVKPLWQTSAT